MPLVIIFCSLFADILTLIHLRLTLSLQIQNLLSRWDTLFSSLVFDEGMKNEMLSILTVSVWVIPTSFFILNIVAYILFYQKKKWGESYLLFLSSTGCVISFLSGGWDLFQGEITSLLNFVACVSYGFSFVLLSKKIKQSRE